MADSKDTQYLGQEEGEYHFSDESVNYDGESETATKEASPEAASPTDSTLSKKMGGGRKRVVAVIAFVVLIALVYKVLVPSSKAPTTDFSQVPSGLKTMPKATPKTMAPAPAVQAEKNPISPPSVANNPIAPPLVSVPATPLVNRNAQPLPSSSAPIVTSPARAALPVISPAPSLAKPAVVTPVVNANANKSPLPAALPPVAASPVAVVSSTSNTPTTPPQPLVKDMMNRLVVLEQEQAASATALQTEYAQKIADNETQVTAMRGKVDELTKRLNRIDSSLTQITQLLQGGSQSAPSGSEDVSNHGMTAAGSAGSPAESIGAAITVPDTVIASPEPKMIYAVQAIIPGRAWLKSESGDTVTVAEGDLLKGYGRITKIDPYDGVVTIDTGHKVITLSYGAGVD